MTSLCPPARGALLTLCAVSALISLPAAAQSVRPEILTSQLEHPWGLAFIGDGRMLVTERPGRMRTVSADGKLGEPLEGLPKIDAGGQGGLLDVVADSDFARNRTVYFCYSEPASSGSGNSTALASARLSDDARRLEKLKVLFSQKPKYSSDAHFGCRIVEAKDGTLFLTLGDRYKRKDDAQTLGNHHGKVVRVSKDGSVPKDNPFVGRRGALPEIWSYGHRNVQGAALGPDGRLWIHEHGAQGGDEINRPDPGKNYGWPVISWGQDYGGGKIGEGLSEKEGMEQPVHYWTPSIAPSGMSFLRSDKYGRDWQGNLFVGALKFRYLDRIVLRDGKVVREEKLLEDLKQRIRDVREGPDGLLYVLTDSPEGQLIRLLPAR
ncbi:PQQ-dependent sugar dehydrogenase [Noviherbaspirillum aridicola]|uniref:Glucose dehydrogenase n=1 Tax=Noviherbaspirillum aridicola TaxID=2849687 RepID=A0ABQ4Q7L1_9BURK|nr:PQQ-dependent sugar dehydrogenase [Noviherbaspirillum aridicola]GIZ53042.1 glucose dehydrogenase [Noviherbaspirillum aridicola]